MNRSGDVGDQAFELYKLLRVQERAAELRIWIMDGKENFSISTAPLQPGQPGLHTRPNQRSRPRRRRKKSTAVKVTPVPTNTVQSTLSPSRRQGCGGYCKSQEPKDEILVEKEGSTFTSPYPRTPTSPFVQLDGSTDQEENCKPEDISLDLDKLFSYQDKNNENESTAPGLQ